MEHWLWEPQTLQSLLTASGVEWDTETIDNLYQQARRNKADELARQAWHAAMEWEIFTTYDVKASDESVMSLAQRLARDHVSHDVPHPTDLGALYHLADSHIRDQEPLYRYIWAEAVAAHVFEHARKHYETTGQIPKDALIQHVVQPTSWSELSIAFQITSEDAGDTGGDNDGRLPLEALWNRYQLN